MAMRCDRCRRKTFEQWEVEGQWLCVDCYQAYKLQKREDDMVLYRDQAYDAEVFKRHQEEWWR